MTGGNDAIAFTMLNQLNAYRVEKCRMHREQGIESTKVVNLIFRCPPVQRRGAVDIDLFRSQPLDAVGEAKAALAGQQGANGGAHAGVYAGRGCQARIVMGFGKIYRDAVAVGDVDGLGQVVFNLFTLIILKQLRIGPV